MQNTLETSILFPGKAGRNDHPDIRKVPNTNIKMVHYKSTKTNKVILYSHGNSCTLEQMLMPLKLLCLETGCSVVSYEYPGYADCKKERGVQSTKDQLTKVYNWVKKTLVKSTQDIILMGRSIGTGPTMHLAASVNFKVGNIVLISAFTSIRDMFHHMLPTFYSGWFVSLFFDNLYDNRRLIKLCPIPVLLIHGKKDKVIPCEMSIEMAKESNNVELQLIDNTDHNNFDFVEHIAKKVNNFLWVD